MSSAPGLRGAQSATLARLSGVAAAVRERFPAVEPIKGDARSLGQALRDALAAVSEEGPVVVVVDNLPRADQASLDAMYVLVERLPPAVLLIATARTGEDEPRLSLPADPSIRRLKLQPLTRSEVEALIGSILELSSEDRAHLAGRLHDQGGGNPFYIVELVSALADEGALAPTEHGAWRLADREGRLPLPPTVREVIARRVARLTPPGRMALEAAAVLALPFDRELLGEVSGGSPVEVESGLEELILHRLVRDAGAPGRYQFAHELVRRHVDQTVPARRSEELLRPRDRRTHVPRGRGRAGRSRTPSTIGPAPPRSTRASRTAEHAPARVARRSRRRGRARRAGPGSAPPRRRRHPRSP